MKKPYQKSSAWKQIDHSKLKTIELTTDVQELSRDCWPRWATASTQFNRIWAYSIHADTNSRKTLPSNGIITELITERIDPQDAPRIYNYNIYLIAETTAGDFFQSPPMKPKDVLHHSSSPSTWFDDIDSPL